jgi:hypothetical protein
MVRPPEGGQHLGSMRAMISYGPRPWPSMWILEETQFDQKVSKVGVPGERFASLTDDYDPFGLAWEDAYPERFWRMLVDDWALLFAEPWKNRAAIGNFYGMYGPLTAFGCENGYESLEAARLGIQWLRELAQLAKWVKDERYGPLWELFKSITWNTSPIYYFMASIPGFDWNERFSIPFYKRSGGERGPDITPDPKSDAELASEIWGAVKHAVWERFQYIPLAPVRSDFHRPKEPVFLWGFEAKGALNAAFLQWFFEELANVSVNTCAAPDCDNIVPAGRERWCSTTCRNRVYKQQQRAKEGR